MQAHQKDEQVQSVFVNKLEEVLKNFTGQLFVNLHAKDISLAAKIVYLAVTTLRGKRTLGEEYTDMVYVNKDGTHFIQKYRKLLFIITYISGPYFISKLAKHCINCYKIYLQKDSNADQMEDGIEELGYRSILNKLSTLHLIQFYLKGTYYDISKRLLGMRYAFGHRMTQQEQEFRNESSNGYKILGYILLIQNLSNSASSLMEMIAKIQANSSQKDKFSSDKDPSNGIITGLREQDNTQHINLSDSSALPFISSESRNCILCLTDMTDPSAASCGHIFCWDCIINWCKERPECPLCRQECHDQQVLLIR